MPTCISLLSHANERIQAVRDAPRRLAAAKRMLEDTGDLAAVLHDHGAYDSILVDEAPDDAVSPGFSCSGTPRTTMKAFPEPGCREIVASLGQSLNWRHTRI
jgi:uncharacterized protein with GYD domain